jgi:hypothetical protein
MKSTLLLLSLLLASAARAGDSVPALGEKQGQSSLPGVPGAGPASDDSDKAAAPAKANPAAPAAVGGTNPTEITIKGSDSSKLGVTKPPLAIELDPFETLRPQLAPDQSLLLAVSPLTVSWRRTHPEFLHNERVIQPYRTTFSARPGIAFRVRDQLQDVMQRKMDPKESKSYAWSLTIADEEGRVFHHWEGSSDPPEELLWSGQNDQGEWIHAGRSYSAVYSFTDSGGSPRTVAGKPLIFHGIVHQEDTGMHLSLDSSILFGTSKNSTELAKPAGVDLLRSSADLIKRKFTGIPVAVRVFAATKELGDSQAEAIQVYLLKELMTGVKNVSTDATRSAFADQRVEIVLLNR